MKKLVYALRFLTILPIPWRKDERLEDVARSASLFPLVGAFVAAAVWAAGAAVGLGFGATVRRVAAVVVWVGITGGLHLDGLADTADGVFGGRTRERRLEIMHDSRIGSFGVLAVVAVLAMKTAVLFDIPAESTASALLLAAVTARVSQVVLMVAFSSARPDGLGAFFKKHLRPADLWIAIVFGGAAGWLAGGYVGVVAAAGGVGLALVLGARLSKALGGLTGDTYGAVSEVVETAVLAAAALLPLSSVLEAAPQW